MSGFICDSSTIMASSCVNKICNHMEQTPPLCRNFTMIDVSVFATNVLGSGLTAEPIIIGKQ